MFNKVMYGFNVNICIRLKHIKEKTKDEMVFKKELLKIV